MAEVDTSRNFETFVRRWLKPAAFVIALAPFAWWGYRALNGQLGANPIEATTRYFGDWALRFLLIALAVTPVRLLTKWNGIARLRRMLGLFAFFYVALHVMSYVGLDLFFDLRLLVQEIVKRRYITVGMFALVILVALAATSTDAMTRRLGGRRWRRLHSLVYPAAIAGVFHYYMMVRAGFIEPLTYGLILAALFAIRMIKKA
ncbi:MAG: sulfoxide reductase heme-binding subunit YedZ [Rhodospirillaceae bacterium]|nr:sulfoxide reductase heme-binding subunit YedZ [Rhodospirillaceae bacterium]